MLKIKVHQTKLNNCAYTYYPDLVCNVPAVDKVLQKSTDRGPRMTKPNMFLNILFLNKLSISYHIYLVLSIINILNVTVKLHLWNTDNSLKHFHLVQRTTCYPAAVTIHNFYTTMIMVYCNYVLWTKYSLVLSMLHINLIKYILLKCVLIIVYNHPISYSYFFLTW